MASPSVVATFSADDTQKHIIEDGLPSETDVVFINDMEDTQRTTAIEQAEFLLSWALERELSDDEVERLRDDQTLQLLSAGVDYLPFDRLPEGMQVLNNAGAYAEPMAEHVLSLYLALSKRLLTEHRNMQNGEFNQFTRNRWVRGSICGIFGFGAIGRATARLLKPLGVRVMAINRHGETDESIEFIGTPDDLDYVLQACDGVVLSAPLTSETRGTITRDELTRMDEDAMLINVARGELVDQRDLYEHLRTNPEFRAGLDAWWTEPVRHGEFELDYPFFDLPNVLGSPHNSAMVPDASELMARHATENLQEAITSGKPDNVVDRQLGY